MNTFILVGNFIIPIIMILIGILYIVNSSKNINSIWSSIVSIAMLFTGLSDDYKASESNITHTLISLNKKYGAIWIGSGLSMLIIVNVLLLLNKSEINNISGSLLELECMILVAVFITVEYVFKRKFHKEANKRS